MASDCRPQALFSPNLLLILIFSNAVAQEAKDKREAIRATWASGLTNQEGSRVHYRQVIPDSVINHITTCIPMLWEEVLSTAL